MINLKIYIVHKFISLHVLLTVQLDTHACMYIEVHGQQNIKLDHNYLFLLFVVTQLVEVLRYKP
jgi:uncharacterized protein YvpB